MAKQKKTKQVDTASFTKPPVVAVMGHVDHGKTSLLDFIRKSRIAIRESGNITQHIGAYQVPVNDKKITFIDTPGHEAFTNLRSRGASVADIALLIIDAKESVKPQTIESIKIIQKAKIPLIVVLNKMDLKDTNPTKVKRDLLAHNVIVEEHGGSIATVEVSAKTGKGVDELLDVILLVSEMKNISADPKDKLQATVIETRKEPGRGNVAAIIVQSGTLSVRDAVHIDSESFTVRALFDEYGKGVKDAFPGAPVEVLGFSNTPSVGSVITRQAQKSEHVEKVEQKSKSDADAILKLFLKADTSGSLEAITAGLSSDVGVIESQIGAVSESNVYHAKTLDLVIIGFNVKVPSRVMKLAKDEGVRIRTYSIIYKLFEEIEEVVTILSQGPQRKIIGEAKIIKSFDTSEGEVAGSQITDGRIARGDTILLTRNDKEIDDQVKIKSIRVEKEEVNKVEKGKMCGILFSSQVDFKVGDMIQSYILYEF